MGAGQSLYQERDNDITMSVEIWNVYIGAMSGMGLGPKLGPTEGVDIRMQSCDAGDGSDANMNGSDVEGGYRHRGRAEKNPDLSNRGFESIMTGSRPVMWHHQVMPQKSPVVPNQRQYIKQ